MSDVAPTAEAVLEYLISRLSATPTRFGSTHRATTAASSR